MKLSYFFIVLIGLLITNSSYSQTSYDTVKEYELEIKTNQISHLKATICDKNRQICYLKQQAMHREKWNYAIAATYGTRLWLVRTPAPVKVIVNTDSLFNNTSQFALFDTDSLKRTPMSVMSISGTGNVGIGTATPNASSLLDLVSTTKGFKLMNMTKAQRDAIPTPPIGTMIYQTDNTPGLRTWNGTNWMRYTETAD